MPQRALRIIRRVVAPFAIAITALFGALSAGAGASTPADGVPAASVPPGPYVTLGDTVGYCRAVGRAPVGPVACTNLDAGETHPGAVTSGPLDLGTPGGAAWLSGSTVRFCRRLVPTDGAGARLACTVLDSDRSFGGDIVSDVLPPAEEAQGAWFPWRASAAGATTSPGALYCRRLTDTGGDRTVGEAARTRLACTPFDGATFRPTVTSAPMPAGAEVEAGAWTSTGPAQTGAAFCGHQGGTTGGDTRLACTPFDGNTFGATITSGPEAESDGSRGTWTAASYCRRVGERGLQGRLACTRFTGTGFEATVTSAVVDRGDDTRPVAWLPGAYCRFVRSGSVTSAPAAADTAVPACLTRTADGFGPDLVGEPLALGGIDRLDRWLDVDGRPAFCTARDRVDNVATVACIVATASGFRRLAAFGTTLDMPLATSSVNAVPVSRSAPHLQLVRPGTVFEPSVVRGLGFTPNGLVSVSVVDIEANAGAGQVIGTVVHVADADGTVAMPLYGCPRTHAPAGAGGNPVQAFDWDTGTWSNQVAVLGRECPR